MATLAQATPQRCPPHLAVRGSILTHRSHRRDRPPGSPRRVVPFVRIYRTRPGVERDDDAVDVVEVATPVVGGVKLRRARTHTAVDLDERVDIVNDRHNSIMSTVPNAYRCQSELGIRNLSIGSASGNNPYERPADKLLHLPEASGPCTTDSRASRSELATERQYGSSVHLQRDLFWVPRLSTSHANERDHQ